MVRAGVGGTTVIWKTSRQFGAGAGSLTWRPAHSTQPRTYVMRLRVGSRVYGGHGPSGRQNAPVVRVQGIDAGFTKRSYAPGESAELRLATDARQLRLQVFAYQSPGRPSEQDVKTSGLAKTGPIRVDWRNHRNASALLRVVRAGDWPSGLYFIRATAADGRVGYAPFIVRPRRLGTQKVAVVLATNTWAAYNFADTDGDGWGDSLVRHRQALERRPAPPVPRLRRPVSLPRLGSGVHRLAESHRADRRTSSRTKTSTRSQAATSSRSATTS